MQVFEFFFSYPKTEKMEEKIKRSNLLFKDLQMLIFEYLNFRPFIKELEYKMSNIKDKLDLSIRDLGSTRFVIINIKGKLLRHSHYFFRPEISSKIYFGLHNSDKMKIVKELLKRTNERRLSLGLKSHPGTHGFGTFNESAILQFGCGLNRCYIAY